MGLFYCKVCIKTPCIEGDTGQIYEALAFNVPAGVRLEGCGIGQDADKNLVVEVHMQIDAENNQEVLKILTAYMDKALGTPVFREAFGFTFQVFDLFHFRGGP